MAQARQSLFVSLAPRAVRGRDGSRPHPGSERAPPLSSPHTARGFATRERVTHGTDRRKRASKAMGAASMNQNPLLTLDALAPCGVVLPTEARAALDTSLTLKARELGVQAFLLWGKFTTSSGRGSVNASAMSLISRGPMSPVHGSRTRTSAGLAISSSREDVAHATCLPALAGREEKGKHDRRVHATAHAIF